MPERITSQTDEHTQVGESGIHVTVTELVAVGKPATIVPDIEVESGEFPREDFEDAPDKVGRSLKGRFAHVPYSSEDFIREKRREAELEDC